MRWTASPAVVRGPVAASAAAGDLAAIAGATDAVAAVEAAEALRGVLWEAVSRELREPAAPRPADVCDRLALVCAEALAASVATLERRPPASAAAGGGGGPDEPPAESPRGERAPSPGEAVIVDERTRHLATVPALEDPAPPAHPSPRTIEIRDERPAGGAAPWIGSIGSQLERFEQDRAPFAVLLVELVDLEQIAAEESRGAAERLAGDVEQLLAGALRSASGQTRGRGAIGAGPSLPTLTRERIGRYWLMAPEMDRAGTQLLAERLTRAAGTAMTTRGRAAAVAIGSALCPVDGREAEALSAYADVGLYAARAAMRAGRTAR